MRRFRQFSQYGSAGTFGPLKHCRKNKAFLCMVSIGPDARQISPLPSLLVKHPRTAGLSPIVHCGNPPLSIHRPSRMPNLRVGFPSSSGRAAGRSIVRQPATRPERTFLHLDQISPVATLESDGLLRKNEFMNGFVAASTAQTV